MGFRYVLFVVSFCLTGFLSGCASESYLPSSKEIVRSQWNSYEEVEADFDRIVPHQTTTDDLKKLGFAPYVTPNTKILNYLDIMERFMPNQSITVKELDPSLQQCLADQDKCYAFEFILRRIESDRYGNVLMDLLSFRRKTIVSGWEFRAIIVIRDGLVVYKLSSGKPKIDEFQDRKNPLGPLQNSEKVIWGTVQ